MHVILGFSVVVLLARSDISTGIFLSTQSPLRSEKNAEKSRYSSLLNKSADFINASESSIESSTFTSDSNLLTDGQNRRRKIRTNDMIKEMTHETCSEGGCGSVSMTKIIKTPDKLIKKNLKDNRPILTKNSRKSGIKAEVKPQSNEYRIKRTILSSYDTSTRPVNNDSIPVIVRVGLSLHNIADTNEKDQTLSATISIRLSWKDEFLQWDPMLYGGVKGIWLPSKQIWTPDIVISNFADRGFQNLGKRLILVRFDGTVSWNFPTPITVYCSMDVRKFPFDSQSCSVAFISWTYHGLLLDLEPEYQTRGSEEHNVDVNDWNDYINTNQEWGITGMTVARHELIYACCPEPYPDVTFTLHITRRSLFYVTNLIFPCVVIFAISFFAFFLPIGSGRRVNLLTTILIALVVFLLIVGDILPPVPDAVPALGLLYGFTLAEVCLALLMATIVINIHVSWSPSSKLSFNPLSHSSDSENTVNICNFFSKNKHKLTATDSSNSNPVKIRSFLSKHKRKAAVADSSRDNWICRNFNAREMIPLDQTQMSRLGKIKMAASCGNLEKSEVVEQRRRSEEFSACSLCPVGNNSSTDDDGFDDDDADVYIRLSCPYCNDENYDVTDTVRRGRQTLSPHSAKITQSQINSRSLDQLNAVRLNKPTNPLNVGMADGSFIDESAPSEGRTPKFIRNVNYRSGGMVRNIRSGIELSCNSLYSSEDRSIRVVNPGQDRSGDKWTEKRRQELARKVDLGFLIFFVTLTVTALVAIFSGMN